MGELWRRKNWAGFLTGEPSNTLHQSGQRWGIDKYHGPWWHGACSTLPRAHNRALLSITGTAQWIMNCLTESLMAGTRLSGLFLCRWWQRWGVWWMAARVRTLLLGSALTSGGLWNTTWAVRETLQRAWIWKAFVPFLFLPGVNHEVLYRNGSFLFSLPWHFLVKGMPFSRWFVCQEITVVRCKWCINCIQKPNNRHLWLKHVDNTGSEKQRTKTVVKKKMCM